jgi:hypothetical protein
MPKKTKKMYEENLNNMGVPDYELKSKGGRIPDHVKYGSWLRKHDFIAFEVGYMAFQRR